MELFMALPVWYWYLMTALFGAVIGSFLNVVIYRFHTGKSLSGHSHCLSCGKSLQWYELVPIVSYVLLRGRCGGCGSYVPPRYLLVEVLTAMLFVASLHYVGFSWHVLWWFTAVSILVVVTVYDLYHFIIPDELVGYLSMLALAGVMLDGWLRGFDWELLAMNLAAALLAFSFYGGLWLYSKGRWIGFGDAKLAAPLAFVAGWPGVFSLIVVSFWVGAVVSIFLLLVPRIQLCVYNLLYSNPVVAKDGKSFTMKSEVPFAPFLVLAFLGVVWLQLDVLSITSYVFSM